MPAIKSRVTKTGLTFLRFISKLELRQRMRERSSFRMFSLHSVYSAVHQCNYSCRLMIISNKPSLEWIFKREDSAAKQDPSPASKCVVPASKYVVPACPSFKVCCLSFKHTLIKNGLPSIIFMNENFFILGVSRSLNTDN
eukprot:g61395.t1